MSPSVPPSAPTATTTAAATGSRGARRVRTGSAAISPSSSDPGERRDVAVLRRWRSNAIAHVDVRRSARAQPSANTRARVAGEDALARGRVGRVDVVATSSPGVCSPSGNGASVPSSTRFAPIASTSRRSAPASKIAESTQKRSQYDDGSCGQSARTMSRCATRCRRGPSSHAKLPPPCANTSSSVARQPLERAGQDQRQDAELRLGRHRDQPRQHPLRASARRPSCPTDARAPAAARPRNGAGNRGCPDRRGSSCPT